MRIRKSILYFKEKTSPLCDKSPDTVGTLEKIFLLDTRGKNAADTCYCPFNLLI